MLTMDATFGEDAFSDQSSDEYEREQLEIALYSQIHFGENEELLENYKNNDNNFVIDVQGNKKRGFTATETNADIILNKGMEKKYGNLVNAEDSVIKEKSPLNIKSGYHVEKLKPSKVDRVRSPATKSSLILDSARKELSQATKIQTLLRDTSNSRQKTMLIEKLILGSDSENEDVDGNSDVVAVLSISDSDDEVLIMSDSDLDSLDVVLGQSDCETVDIQMNVHSNPRYTYKKMSHEECTPCDGAKDSDDVVHWAINREDSFKDIGAAATSRQGRYYKPIRCHNCNHVGHLSKNCPKPKKVTVCAMCSEPGHICRNCPQAMCFNCEEPGHGSRTCAAPRRNLNSVCHRCNMQGHNQNKCPDIWRQYHVTVTPGNVQQFPSQDKRRRPSCFNCGDEGHFGHECEEERMNKFLKVSTPFVCKYNTVAQINYIVRQFDETNDRPIKRSRSENWTGNISNRHNSEAYKIKRNKTFTFDKDFSEKKSNKVNEKRDMGGSVENNVKKQSQFAHIIKKGPNDKTGRNNFDKMQFTKLNKNMMDKYSNELSEKACKKKSKKKKKKGKEKSSTQTSDSQRIDKDMRKGSSQSMEQSKKEEILRKSQQNLAEGSNERKVTVNSSGMTLTFQAKSNLSGVSVSRQGEKIIENKPVQKTVDIDQKSVKKNKKKRRNCSRINEVDFTINRETGVAKAQAGLSSRNLKKCKNERKYNLRQRSDDLFSLQKIEKLQSGHHIDSPVVEEDVEHQVDNNEWWRRKGKKKHPLGNKKHVFFY